MKVSKPKRPASARRGENFPSYSVTQIRRDMRSALRDAAAHGIAVVRKRGQVIGFLVKPSLYRILASGKLPPQSERWDKGTKLLAQFIRAVQGAATRQAQEESAEKRFRMRQRRGNPNRALALLRKLDREDRRKGIAGKRP